jgi:hypothetical protein
MSIPRLFAIAWSLAMALPTSGTAQGRPVELGIDAGGSFELSGSNTVVVGLPTQDFRVGFFVSDAISVEPRVAFTHVEQDGSSLTAVSAQLGPVIHFSPDRSRTQGYVRPFAGINYLTDYGSGFTAGGALGVKLPLVERLAARVEGSYVHGFDSGNALGFTVGLSFLTH